MTTIEQRDINNEALRLEEISGLEEEKLAILESIQEKLIDHIFEMKDLADFLEDTVTDLAKTDNEQDGDFYRHLLGKYVAYGSATGSIQDGVEYFMLVLNELFDYLMNGKRYVRVHGLPEEETPYIKKVLVTKNACYCPNCKKWISRTFEKCLFCNRDMGNH